MRRSIEAPRLSRLPRKPVAGVEVRVAVGLRARLFGLAALERDEVGAGLLIPRCRSVHTFGMRFGIDVCFLGSDLEPIAIVSDVGPRRFVSHRAAKAVLETPRGGEPAGGAA